MNQDANAVNVADSSDAAIAEPVETEDLSDEQRTEWIKTGDLPIKETQPKSGESATPKPGEAGKTADAKEAESGTAPKKDKPNQERNWRQLEAAKEAESKRAEKAERELAELKKTVDAKAASSTAPPAEVAVPQAPERPKRDAFESQEKYEDALFEWRDKQRAYETAKAQADKRKTEIDAWNKDIEGKWKARVDAAKGKHDDFEAIAFAKDLPIPWGSPVDQFILHSELGAEMLYHFGKNRDELVKLNAMSVPQQFRELSKLEDTLGGTPKKEDDKKEETPKAKLVTDALPPPKEVGGKGTAAEDEEETALKAGNVDRYIELANKRELAQRKKK